MYSTQIPPAQLWIGNHEYLTDYTTTYLQKLFCSHGCGTCITCMQIRQQQHHAIVWICPEKGYTLAHTQAIHERIAFALAPDERLFFVLQKADYLTIQCANSLLKSLEEPPHGYHFILCAQQQEAILATIRSRCIVTVHKHTHAAAHNALLERFFYTAANHVPDAQEYAQLLQKTPLSEQQAQLLVDELLVHWIERYKQLLQKEQHASATSAAQKIACIKEVAAQPPMPGSSTLFLKQLFVRYHMVQ